MTLALTFAIGFAMVFCVSLNTRLLAAPKPAFAHIAVTSLSIQLLWAFGVRSVRSVSHDALHVPFYAVGATCGCLCAARMRLRREL